MFSLLSVYLLSVFFCTHSCPCLEQTAVTSVCFSPGWAAALFVWLLPLGAVAWITLAFQSMRWRAWKESPVLSHFPSKETTWQGRWSFGSFPHAFSSLMPSSVTPPPLLSISQWMTKNELVLAHQLSLAAVRWCLGLVRPITLLGVLDLDLHIICITSQFQRSILWNPKEKTFAD